MPRGLNLKPGDSVAQSGAMRIRMSESVRGIERYSLQPRNETPLDKHDAFDPGLGPRVTPGSRMETGRWHCIPLSPRAAENIRAVH